MKKVFTILLGLFLSVLGYAQGVAIRSGNGLGTNTTLYSPALLGGGGTANSLTNVILFGTSPRFDLDSLPLFDASSELGWLQLQADGKFQLTRDASSLTNGSTTNFFGAGTIPVSKLPAAGLAWDTIITKSAPQSVTNSSTVVSDTELTTTLTSNAFYMVELIIIYSGNDTTGDMKGHLLTPTITAGVVLGFHYTFNGSAAITFAALANAPTQWPSVDLTFAGLAGDTPLTGYMQMAFKTESTGGTLVWQFANANAGIGRTSTTHAGSTLRVKRLF